ncbi:MAG TPA: hypothetical protein VNO30_07175 [Kofleriaceae bacterium]|nr:hypothetical protein [Kofleriaceae bacterium]
MKILATATTALLLLCGACSTRAQFQPTENVSAVSPSGQPAASYELRIDQSSDPKITVNVWSDGVARHDDRTYVDLAVEVRNTSDDAVELDRDTLALEAFDAHGTPLPAPRLASLRPERGSMQIAPRSASTTQLRFDLLMPIAPDRVGALRFRWGVRRGDGERYVQLTDFRRQPAHVASAATVAYDPIFGFYDPFFYGPPYGYHMNYYVPVARVVVEPRDRPRPGRR